MKVDMSPEAVTARLKLVSQLRRLCLALGKAQPVEDIVDPKPSPSPSSDLQGAKTEQMNRA